MKPRRSVAITLWGDPEGSSKPHLPRSDDFTGTLPIIGGRDTKRTAPSLKALEKVIRLVPLLERLRAETRPGHDQAPPAAHANGEHDRRTLLERLRAHPERHFSNEIL